MTMIKSPSQEMELVHYGVKGMHWGVRKNTPDNPNYTVEQRKIDRRNHGQGGVKRINRQLNKGANLTFARKKEAKFQQRRSSAVAVGLLAVRYRKQVKTGAKVAKAILSLAAGIAVQHIAVKAETNRGRAAAANAMGLPSHAHGPTFAKKSRGGVHNITTI